MSAVAEVRSFTRFWSGVIGLLDEGLLDTRWSLPEARVIFELAQESSMAVGALRAALGVDAGYLSRLLARLESTGVVAREKAPGDARRQIVRLTRSGRSAFRDLDRRSDAQVAALLSPLDDERAERLAGALRTARSLLEDREPADAPRSVVLRPAVSGDWGWMVMRHGALYAQEYGWDDTFEALVARIVADHVADRDPRREATWIAEVEGRPAGCVMCVRDPEDPAAARLRCLLVEPRARGLGVGGRLVEECLRFARRAGYEAIGLWTNDVLVDARRVYERAGFSLVASEPHHAFGHDLVGQTWRRAL